MGLELTPARGKDICRLGEMVKIACQEQYPVNHPEFDYPVSLSSSGWREIQQAWREASGYDWAGASGLSVESGQRTRRCWGRRGAT